MEVQNSGSRIFHGFIKRASTTGQRYSIQGFCAIYPDDLLEYENSALFDFIFVDRCAFKFDQVR
jgi:hypothetical protein